MRDIPYLNRSGRNRVSGHADEDDRDRCGKRHHAAMSGIWDAYGIERVAEGDSPEEDCDRRSISFPTRGCSRREKRVECPESRASMKYIEGCVLLLF